MSELDEPPNPKQTEINSPIEEIARQLDLQAAGEELLAQIDNPSTTSEILEAGKQDILEAYEEAEQELEKQARENNVNLEELRKIIYRRFIKEKKQGLENERAKISLLDTEIANYLGKRISILDSMASEYK